MLQDRVKEYKNSVIRCLMHKYDLSEFEANKAIRQSYLPDSLKNYPGETIHEDVETTADDVYYDYIHPALMRM